GRIFSHNRWNLQAFCSAKATKIRRGLAGVRDYLANGYGACAPVATSANSRRLEFMCHGPVAKDFALGGETNETLQRDRHFQDAVRPRDLPTGARSARPPHRRRLGVTEAAEIERRASAPCATVQAATRRSAGGLLAASDTTIGGCSRAPENQS